MPYPFETVTALAGKRWTVNDKKGREIYLTHERLGYAYHSARKPSRNEGL